MADFYEDPGTGWRETEDEREAAAWDAQEAEELAAWEAAEAAAWEAHYGTEDERDEALVEPDGTVYEPDDWRWTTGPTVGER